jgi:hypothetical protein
MDSSLKKWRRRIFLSLALPAGLALLSAGCESYQHKPVLADPVIKAGPAETYVKPQYQNYRAYRLAIMPFRVPTTVPDVGYPLTELFHRQLLANKTFREAIRISEYHNTMAEAQHLAKSKGAEVFLLGEVPYYLDSGTTGKSGLQVDLRVVETATGRTIWYLTDAISSTPRPIINIWITETKPKPSASISYLAAVLANRMCHSLEDQLDQCIQQGICTPDSNS